MDNLQEKALDNVRLFFIPLVGASKSPIELIQYFKNAGWHLDAIATTSNLSAFINRINNLVASVEAATTLLENPPSTWSEWSALASAVASVSDDIKALPQAIPQLPTPIELADDILQGLANTFLNTYYPGAYSFLTLFGIVEKRTIIPITQGGILIREKGLVPYLNLRKLKGLITNPKQELKALYWPNGLATRAEADQAADRIFPLLSILANDFGFSSLYDPEAEYDDIDSAANSLAARMLTIERFFSIDSAGLVSSIGATIGLISQSELQAERLANEPAISSGDAGVSILPFGTLGFTRTAGNWLVTLSGSASIPGFQVSQRGIKFLETSQAISQGGLILNLQNLAQKEQGVALRIGPSTGTRVEIAEIKGNAYLQFTGHDIDYGFSLVLPNNKLILLSGDGDSFLQKILQTTKDIPFELNLGWSKTSGFYIGAAGGFEHLITINTPTNSFLNIEKAIVGLQFDSAGDVRLTVAASGTVTLGPVHLTVERTGIQAIIGFTNGTGNFGPVDLDLGFKLPSGIGIAVNSEAVRGGGYLFLDPANHKYAGVAQLTFKDKINLNAVGILQTVLPNNRPGYSFLLLITAQFSPIQLGLGFTLNGIGGLVGINRTASTNALRGLVQSGRTDTLLFPANVLDNPQAAVATVDSAFPAAEGRYVFGLMAKIGWGTPNLLTLDAALIIEVPAPVRLILLGVLRATLPNESSAIIRLRADFIGIVDFGAKKIAFDAVLVDSRILQFALTGSFAFRLYSGDNPVFLMTAGGFHPAFQPPANADLPTLRRLTLALASGGDFRLTLSSYLAITSNTVQFGSRLDLFADLPGPFTLQGYLGFDALFRFNPFYLEVYIGAGVAIKRGSRSVLSISLDLRVSGPAPWHVEGEGRFRVLFFKIKFRIDRTFGGGAAQPALPPTDVRRLLVAALADKSNWEVQAPAIKPGNTVVLRTEDQPSELVIDPGGVLAVRQKVVPFDFPVEVYGNTPTTNGNRFTVRAVVLGSATTQSSSLTGSQLDTLREAFAPSQYRQMRDDEKLSAPSFQRLPGGLRLTTLDGLTGHAGQTRTIDFEERLFAPGSPGTGGQNRQQQPTTPPATSVGNFAAGNLHRLARTGAIGQSRRSHEQRRPSRLAPDQVLWSEDSYAVVSVRTLQPDPDAPNPFKTEAEATAYLHEHLRAAPAEAGEWQVLPVYQLDVSAPSLSANLVTV